MARFALRWILDQPGVTVVIPGARYPERARGNAAAAQRPALSEEHLVGVREGYDSMIRPHVHQRW